MKILVVEDEPKLADFIYKGLTENNCEVEVAHNGEEALKKITENTYDAFVIDVNIPKINGLELTSTLRKNRINTPILMLTAMGSLEDKLRGFEAGADDYLVKPFEFDELVVRLKALHRRSENIPLNLLKIADLELDLNQKIARRANKNIDLTAREFGLLEFLMRNQGKVVSRTEIAEKVWDIKFDTGTNTIDVYINFLRRKIDKNSSTKLIQTVVGMGYILREES